MNDEYVELFDKIVEVVVTLIFGGVPTQPQKAVVKEYLIAKGVWDEIDGIRGRELARECLRKQQLEGLED